MDWSPVIWALAAASLVAAIGLALAARRVKMLQEAVHTAWDDREAARAAERRMTFADAVSQTERSALGTAAPDALLLLDQDKRITWVNEAAQQMFENASPDPGKPFLNLVQDLELYQAVVDALRGARPIERQAVIGQRTLRIRAVPFENQGGVAVALQDVTELQRLGRARRDLVANLSHELRTPLATIDLAAETLLGMGAPPDPALTQRLIQGIRNQARTLSQLSQEIIDLAQIESGQVLMKLVPAPVGGMVERAVDDLRPQAEAKNQGIDVAVAEDLLALMDVQQVSRVVTNLLHNAIKFTPAGGLIHIRAEPWQGDDVLVCVSDTGPGIPESEHLRVFERFYQQDRARGRGGTGLGLAIAKHIVEGHGGRIWVESTPGQGASFRFTLPTP